MESYFRCHLQVYLESDFTYLNCLSIIVIKIFKQFFVSTLKFQNNLINRSRHCSCSTKQVLLKSLPKHKEKLCWSLFSIEAKVPKACNFFLQNFKSTTFLKHSHKHGQTKQKLSLLKGGDLKGFISLSNIFLMNATGTFQMDSNFILLQIDLSVSRSNTFHMKNHRNESNVLEDQQTLTA